MRAYLTLWFPLSLYAAVAARQERVAPPPDPVEIVRKSLEKDRLNFERAKDYTYEQRREMRYLDSSGRIRKVETSTYDVLIIEGRPYSRKIAANDKPLPPEEARKAEAQFERALRDRQRETEEERKRKAAESERNRVEERAFINEIPKAFVFRLVREEAIDGLPAWVIEAEPKKGYKPRAKRADMLAKFRGRLWIDQEDYQWVRVEAETLAPISFGWILARLGPGAKLTFLQTRVNSEIWLPSHATMRIDARLAVLKHLNVEMEVGWRNYKKFTTDSRVVSAEEIRQE